MYSAYKLNMPHSFIELDKAVVHVISMISFLWLWLVLFSYIHWLVYNIHKEIYQAVLNILPYITVYIFKIIII